MARIENVVSSYHSCCQPFARMRSLANTPAVSFEAANATKILFCCVRKGLEWSDFKKPETPNFSPLFGFQQLPHKMSPSCGLLHSWGCVFIWPGSAARPENPQTAGCCSCAPSVLRGPSSFADTLLLRGYPRMDNQPTDSAQNRQLVQFFRHAAFADDAAFWLALSEILSAQSFCQSPPPPLNGQSPSLPTKMPRLGFHPQPGPKFSLLRNQE